jgi:Holliday junction resolvase-like predicted endonuclease
MSVYKPELLTLEQLLDKRITEWRNSVPRTSRGSNSETEFSNHIEPLLPEVLEHLGYQVEAISREFYLQQGRVDFLVKTHNGYIVIEVKRSNEKINSDLYFSYAIGQVLTYKSLIAAQYKISMDKIDCIIITDNDSALLGATIANNELNITHLVVADEGVKCYV